MAELIRILIDAQDQVAETNQAWDRVARSARLQDLVGHRAQGSAFIEHLTHSAHRQLAAEILRLVRERDNSCVVYYRPDDDDREYAVMVSAARRPDDQVELWVNTGQSREAQAAQDRPLLVTMCSVCRRIRNEQAWIDAVIASQTMDLLALHPAPVISHGLCPDCNGQPVNGTG